VVKSASEPAQFAPYLRHAAPRHLDDGEFSGNIHSRLALLQHQPD
jgi:hypothetical protein